MKAFMRLGTMCLWLTATSPVCWALVAVALYSVWKWHLPQWVWFWMFVCAAVVGLVLSLFVEAGGGLYDRLRFARSGRIVMGAAAAAITVFALSLWAISSALLRQLP